MICSKCGANIPDGSLFCAQCGTQYVYNQVPNPQQGLQVNMVQNQQPVYNNADNKKDNSSWKWIIVIILLLIVVALLCLLLFNSKNNGAEDNDNRISLTANKGTRTVLIYMIGSDLESQYGAATMDINEILYSNFDEDSLNIYIYTGGSKNGTTLL